MTHVLVVDDEPGFSSGIAEYLRLQGYTVDCADSIATARDTLRERRPAFVLLDLMLPDGNGLELLGDFERERPEKIVIVTGHSGIKSLIGNVAGEGVSYLQKPVEPQELLGLLNTVSGTASSSERADGPGRMLGDSDAMRAVYAQIEKVASTDSTVLIQGESGTGKELVADAVHRLSGRAGPFVPVNCGGLTRELVASQLFGHEKGAFTGATARHKGLFERASGGTLFLDEITEMSADMQTQLLRVLETQTIQRVGGVEDIPVDARLIAATNRDPAQAVRDGVLREDLYFRLRVFPIALPPLRQRAGDVRLLAEHFLAELNAKYDEDKTFSDGALERLEAHNWPGNVRELKHAIHRAWILAEDGKLRVPERFDESLPGGIEGVTVGRSIAEVEKDLILATLEHLDGDKNAAAASLGISLKTLYNRLKAYEAADAGGA